MPTSILSRLLLLSDMRNNSHTSAVAKIVRNYTEKWNRAMPLPFPKNPNALLLNSSTVRHRFDFSTIFISLMRGDEMKYEFLQLSSFKSKTLATSLNYFYQSIENNFSSVLVSFTS